MRIFDKLKKLLEPKYAFDNAPKVVPDAVYQQQFLSRKEWMGQFEFNGRLFSVLLIMESCMKDITI